MATQTVCDHCGKVLSPHLSSYRVTWSNDFGQPPRDYCSTPCAVRALGGQWPDDGAPQPSHGNHYRTIPWPPSEETVERVAGELCSRFSSGRVPWINAEAWLRDEFRHGARAVLDAIAGDR